MQRHAIRLVFDDSAGNIAHGGTHGGDRLLDHRTETAPLLALDAAALRPGDVEAVATGIDQARQTDARLEVRP
jgi:hypothetical protein